MIRRRMLLATTALAFTLGACGVPASAAAWATDASALATGLDDLLPQIASIANIPADAANAASKALTAAAAMAKQLAGTAVATTGAPLLSQIEGYVNTAFQALSPYFSLLPAPFSTALTAINLLLPFIETALGMVAANVSVSRVRAPMLVRIAPPAQAPVNMSPAQAHDWAVSVLTSGLK